MYEIEKEINSIAEYIQFIFEYKSKVGCELWYRGQSNNHWLLDPSINRNKTMDIEPLKNGEVSKLRYTNIVDFTEEIRLFKKKLQKHVPTNFNNFHFMFLGQHYGLKTPALDWSTDPLVALYFSLKGYDKTKNSYPVVFILKPCLLNSYSQIVKSNKEPIEFIEQPFVIDNLSNSIFNEWFSDMNDTPFSPVPFAVKSDFDISYRITRQSGVFTLHDTRQPLNYPWIQTKIKGETFGITLKINPEAVENIWNHLIALDITEDTLYGKSHKEWDQLCEKVVEQTPVL